MENRPRAARLQPLLKVIVTGASLTLVAGCPPARDPGPIGGAFADEKRGCAIDGETAVAPRVAPAPAAIIGGQLEAPVDTLSSGQVLALGAIVARGTDRSMCSATLIARDLVLTAAHCVIDRGWDGQPSTAAAAAMVSASQMEFVMGADVSEAVARIGVVEVLVHPDVQAVAGDYRWVPSSLGYDHDLAILRLAHVAALDSPAVEPIPIMRGDLADAVGGRVLVGGFGIAGPGTDTGRRRFAEFGLGLTTERYAVFNLVGEGSTQPGDSGAGYLMQTATGWRVVATTQGPLPPNQEFAPRVDRHLDWLSTIVPDPCDGIDGAGSCDGTTLVTCANGEILRQACDPSGQTCGADDCGVARCLTPPTAPPDEICADLNYRGRCLEGNVVEWCAGGFHRRRDCGALGQRCGDTGDPAVGAYCLGDPGLVDGAALVDGGAGDGSLPPVTLSHRRCGALLGCMESCESDLLCHLRCEEAATTEAKAGLFAVARCQLCAFYPLGGTCEPSDSHSNLCGAECSQEGPPCRACLDRVCMDAVATCRGAT